ncbi:hypothetical protein ABH15_01535 [Methanoculleus taiwanensis]|uniref:Uncharacterized protein n=1 Tax=Methanoculleus taiwanensis TaxID=1550565 RepID=A0A498H295_9EURY|nr:DUF2703 domain-containing protein [Methanoculleus taiwanensis]RXE56863.1 hypothetical protein ABH15_01535 [Methanoculleus taiwanensis]
MEGEVVIEWRRPEPPRSPEKARAFRAVLEDLRRRLEERGVGVAVTETPLFGDAAGQVLMNGVPVEDLVPVQGREEGCNGCVGSGAGCGLPACEELSESVLCLAALRASELRR